ncbi:HepT-like ribonuclease domain-containing protein [Cyclobacterium plantarum]|uniref:HepT-like ribonuclease domain-containing protein n=1 Tax=Cyclobacterium plantarum TaxID=2716263 RepID=UPI003F72A43F
MDNKINTWLFDILNSIEEIESFFEDTPLNFLENQKDIKTKRAVERNSEIIGEAVNRILKEKPDFKIENSRNIIGTRNRIIHSYDNIADQMICSIVINSLPKLKSEFLILLK